MIRPLTNQEPWLAKHYGVVQGLRVEQHNPATPRKTSAGKWPSVLPFSKSKSKKGIS
jgi:hypothetical protein